MSYPRKRKHRSRRSPPAYEHTQPSEPDPALFITAHEADIIRGPHAISAAEALEITYATSQNGQREILKVGDGLMKWERQDAGGDVWVDRYDARLLLDALPAIASPPAPRAPSPSGWSDLPSDAEDTFFFSPEEAEDYHREKRRRLIDQLREERLRAREAEDDVLKAPPEEQWGGSDEEPDDEQAGVMRRTAAHVVASPNAAQLEMRILANHGADPRFAFLRGRWARAWPRTKAQARRDVAKEKEKEGNAGAATALGGLMGYEGSDESEDGDDEADAAGNEERNDNGHGNEGTAAEDNAEQAIKEARRARAREWAEKRRATKAQSPEPAEPS